jgi:glycosyltransferase involved in cell wall biosynthesis
VARSVIGIPLRAGGAYTEHALRSLFAQTDRDVAFVLVDDASPEESVAAALAAAEPRATYARNEQRRGLVDNWRFVFRRARELHPEATYFAWGSDHDVWQPTWLASLVSALESEPRAVLAYPLGARIVDDEVRLREAPRILDTRDCRGPLSRFVATARNVAAGWMVYGLYRADALERTGLLRHVLMPDRLLLLELSLQGPFVHVREVLWHRRFRHEQIVARQRESLFAGRPPLHVRLQLPHWLVHAAVLGVHGGMRAGAAYPFLWLRRELDDAGRRLAIRSRSVRLRVRALLARRAAS